MYVVSPIGIGAVNRWNGFGVQRYQPIARHDSTESVQTTWLSYKSRIGSIENAS